MSRMSEELYWCSLSSWPGRSSAKGDKNRTWVSGCATGSGRNSGGRSHTEDDDGNVYRAKHAEFVRLFEEAVLALGAGGRGGGVGWKATTAGSVKNRENLPRHQHKNSHSRNSTTRSALERTFRKVTDLLRSCCRKTGTSASRRWRVCRQRHSIGENRGSERPAGAP